jgi:allantoicase
MVLLHRRGRMSLLLHLSILLELNGEDVLCRTQTLIMVSPAILMKGEPNNMLREGRGVNMGDGWETARNPNRPEVFVEKDGVLEMPGWDWCIIKLGTVGKVAK